VRTIHGNYILVVSVPFDARIDLGNVIKATEDLLTKMQVIEDDRLATYIVLRRSGELAGGDRMKVSVSAEDGALQ
jgi:Holliday junction resolvase RusA-like endonuclease